MIEEVQGFLHRHVQHVVNALSLVFYLQSLPVIPFPVTNLTGHVHVRQEMHLDLQDAVPAAGLAAAALHVETEPALLVASGLGVRRGREKIPDQVEDAGIRGRIGPGRPPDGRLVDGDHLVQLLHPLDILVLPGDGPGPVQFPCQPLVHDLIDQGTLAGTGDSGNAGHDPKRDLHVNILQVVFPGPGHLKPP